MLDLIRSHWRLAFAATFAVVVCRLLLWFVPFRWARQLGGSARTSHPAPPDLGRRHRIAAAVRIVSHKVPGATCLTQALATQTLLNLVGDFVPLQLGVAGNADGRFEAHAWLESGGRILIGDLPDLDRYRRLENPMVTA